MASIPAATTLIAADGRRACSRIPARSDPSGITPQPICRATLLVRPSSSFGVIRIRYVWTETFHDGPTKPIAATTGHSHHGARTAAIRASSTAQIHMHPVIVIPAGIRRWNAGSGERARQAADPHAPDDDADLRR